MNNKINLLLVSPTPPPYGGIANWSLMIIDEIKKNNKDIELIHLDISPKKSFADGRNLKNRIIDSGLEMIKLRKKLVQIIKENNIDVVHLTTSGQLAIIRDILFMKTLKKFKIPVVYHLRIGRIPEMMRKKNLEWKLFNKAFCMASLIVAIDQETYNSINSINKFKVIKIPNPIKPINNICIEEKNKISFLGHVKKEKGIEELIQAFNEIKNDININLEIIGPFSEEFYHYLKKYDLSKIIFRGEMKHTEALKEIAKCKIFILPSYTEGFPNVVLEAMQLNKAIIATNVGAIPEMLDDNCGIVINSKNVQQLKEALIMLNENNSLRKIIANNAFEKSNEEYLLDKVMMKYKKVWQDLKKNAEEEK